MPWHLSGAASAQRPSWRGPGCAPATAARRRRRASGSGTGCCTGIPPRSRPGWRGYEHVGRAQEVLLRWPRRRRWRRRGCAGWSPGSRGDSGSAGRRGRSGSSACASSQAARTTLMPAGSMACGFSTNTCLPASMAAITCIGWNLAALAMSTTSDALDHVLVAVEAGEAVVVAGATCSGHFTLQRVALLLHAVSQHVGHGDQAHALVGDQGLVGGLRCRGRRSRSGRPG